MTKDQMMAVIGSQQDQDVESAKDWMFRKDGMVNAQAMVLWEACCMESDSELMDAITRFALIGIRHVMSLESSAKP